MTFSMCGFFDWSFWWKLVHVDFAEGKWKTTKPKH